MWRTFIHSSYPLSLAIWKATLNPFEFIHTLLDFVLWLAAAIICNWISLCGLDNSGANVCCYVAVTVQYTSMCGSSLILVLELLIAFLHIKSMAAISGVCDEQIKARDPSADRASGSPLSFLGKALILL